MISQIYCLSKSIWIALFLICGVGCIKGSELSNNDCKSCIAKTENENAQIYNAFFTTSKSLLLKVLLSSAGVINSTDCRDRLINLKDEVFQQQKKVSTFAFLSSGKVPSGLLDLLMADHGDFEECRELQWRYMTAFIRAPLPHEIPPKVISDLVPELGEDPDTSTFQKLANFRLGLCLPQECSRADVQEIFDRSTFWEFNSKAY